MSSASPSERLPIALTPSTKRGSAPRTVLPAPLTPLLGRDREVAEVKALLDRDDTRLLTLTGPGGIGKTRLALEVAAQVQDDFAHGVCFVSLAAIRDPHLVPSAIAQALGVRESDERPVAEVLMTALHGQHLLLVLDNLEHVVACAPWLTELLVNCSRVKALITSRVLLRIRSEQHIPVPPLAVPVSESRTSVETLSAYAAVELFITRACAVQSTFVLDKTNAGIVAEICHRLDGLPLAIELAAARINVLSPAAILARLGDRLTLLTGSMQDAPERHRTMRDAIAWSYDLLTPDEQALFRRLAVFSGGFTLDAARAIAIAGDGEPEQKDMLGSDPPVLDLMASLVDQNLIRQMSSEGDEPRFGVLETIREYGLDQLVASSESDQVAHRHAAWFFALAEEAAPRLHGDDQVSWMTRLQTERANLRAALAWALEQGEARLGLRVASSLWWFWWVRGDFTEGLATLDALLALPAASAPTMERGRAIAAAGSLAMMKSSPRDIEAMFRDALAIARDLDDQPGAAFALLSLGFLSVLRGDDGDVAISWLDQGRELYHLLGDDWGRAAAIHFLGWIALAQGELELAISHLNEALAIYRDARDLHGVASSFNILGLVTRKSGDTEKAQQLYREALQLYGKIGDRGSLIIALEGLAGVLGMCGQTERSARLFGAAAAHRRLRGAPVLPSELSMYEADLDGARLALGDAAFAAAWAEGQAMTLDEAIAAALSEEAQTSPAASAGGAVTDAPAHGLSPRELEVLKLMADGLTNQEIADTLFLSRRTATSHASNILGKLGLSSRTAAVAYAIRHGIA